MNASIGVAAAVALMVGTSSVAQDIGQASETSHASSAGVEMLSSIDRNIAGLDAGQFAAHEVFALDGMPTLVDGPSSRVRFVSYAVADEGDTLGENAADAPGTHALVARLGSVSAAVEVDHPIAVGEATAPQAAVSHESSAFFDLLIWLLGAVGFIVVWMISVIWILSGVRRFLTARS